METTTPLFPCKSLDVTLDFYQTLGFQVTYQQHSPYPYGAVCQGNVVLHFAKLTTHGSRHAVCLVHVPDVAVHHKAFADAIRAKYGRVLTAGCPRITRLQMGQTRFHLFDPAGNILIYINQDEPDGDYTSEANNMSPLALALENAIFLRDTYVNDVAAAGVLDKALARYPQADAMDRASALAARAELAVALGQTERTQTLRAELSQIILPDAERERLQTELQAADKLEQWITSG
jgi:hypothetical protein